MKFVCDRCQTRYTIADEKIRQRIVRIRCKNCGDVITLHSGEVVAGPQDASARLSSTIPVAPPEVRVSSKVSRPPLPRCEWFVAIDGIEKGPLSCAEAAKYIAALESGQVVHVWKEGMDEWKRPKDVAIIAQELSALRRSPGKAPAAAQDAASADATVVTPVPVAFNTPAKPAPPAAIGSAPKLPGLAPKASSLGSAPKGAPLPSLRAGSRPALSGSAPKPVPGLSGSGPKHAPPPVPGSGPKAAPLPSSGSGPKSAPPPVLAGHRAPPPIPGIGAKPSPAAASSAVSEARPAAKSSTMPVVKTPPPKTAQQPRLEAEAGHTPAPASAPDVSTPGAQSEFDDDVPTSPDARRRAAFAAKVPGPESTPPVENTPGVEDFSESEKTPPPSQPLPPVGSTVPPARESRNWPVAGLTFAHPPAMPEGMSAEGAMALPTPAPLSGPLFGKVADMQVKSLVGHAEVGLSKLTGLAALVQKHHHLKYVAAAGILIVLIISVILFSWRSDGAKELGKVAEIEKKARAAALAAEPIPLPPGQPAVAPSLVPSVESPPSVESVPSKSHVPAAAHAGKRPVRPVASSPSDKPAPSDPFAPPAGMTRSEEKPIPLAAIQGKRASASPQARAISQSQISDVIRKKENQAGLKTCYERALKRDGRLRTGRLDITVSIGPMGTVQRVQVHGSADFMVIDKCLKGAIRHWRFPANSEEYATSFPLILQGG